MKGIIKCIGNFQTFTRCKQTVKRPMGNKESFQIRIYPSQDLVSEYYGLVPNDMFLKLTSHTVSKHLIT